MPRKNSEYTVSDAQYYSSKGWRQISGVPAHATNAFGQYYGGYPSEAASKAYSNMLTHMRKFRDPWFIDYDPMDPPEIRFSLVKLGSRDVYKYSGTRHRIPERTVVSPDGRERTYRWENKITKLQS